jgi:hypothetical protein
MTNCRRRDRAAAVRGGVYRLTPIKNQERPLVQQCDGCSPNLQGNGNTLGPTLKEFSGAKSVQGEMTV